MKIAHHLSVIFSILISFVSFTGCDKSNEITNSPLPPIVLEKPLQEYAFTNNILKNNLLLQVKQPDFSTEIGMQFSASKNGILWSIGFKLPIKGKYFISLWEAASQQLILTDSVTYTDTSKFIYKPLLSLNKAVVVDKNKDYMTGIFLPNRRPESPLSYYVLSNPGVQSFMFTQGHITYKATPVVNATTPVYPGIKSLDRNFICGLVDIGYYATEF